MNLPIDEALGDGVTARALEVTTIDNNQPTMTQSRKGDKIFITLIWPEATQSLILDLENMHVTWSAGFCVSAEPSAQQTFAATLASSLLPLANELGFKTTSLMAFDDMADFLEQEGLTRKTQTTLEADLTDDQLLQTWRTDA